MCHIQWRDWVGVKGPPTVPDEKGHLYVLLVWCFLACTQPVCTQVVSVVTGVDDVGVGQLTNSLKLLHCKAQAGSRVAQVVLVLLVGLAYAGAGVVFGVSAGRALQLAFLSEHVMSCGVSSSSAACSYWQAQRCVYSWLYSRCTEDQLSSRVYTLTCAVNTAAAGTVCVFVSCSAHLRHPNVGCKSLSR